MNVEEYVNSIDEPMKTIVTKLRLAIKGVSNELNEEIKWNVPTYSTDKNICSIMAHKNHVNLQIFQGAKIKDANELLGSGKDMRHLRYDNLMEVNEFEVRKYLKQVMKIDA